MKRFSGRRPGHATVVSYLALFVALATGGAWAAATIGSKDIRAGAVRSKQIKNGQVKSPDVRDDDVTGDDVNESTLGQVRDSALFAGKPPAAYLSSQVNAQSSAISPGTLLAGGNRQQSVSCAGGDLAIGGYVSRVDPTSLLHEAGTSFTGYSASIVPDTNGDDFQVTAICVDQP